MLEVEELPIKDASKFKRKALLTVCIAAICENNQIFGASDRMMTAGDIEFEPNLNSFKKPAPHEISQNFTTNVKVFPITNSIVAMTAGDAGLQCEILQSAKEAIIKQLSSQPNRQLLVQEAVDIYVDFYNRAKAKRLKDAVFVPYGLDESAFISRQSEMSKDFILDISKKIQIFESRFSSSNSIETIITGIDVVNGSISPHIYSVIKSINGDAVICCDSIGFAAVGSGARHASSQFMLAGHNKFSRMPETILLTYLSKKRSEIAPGVGSGTDMFVIGPQLNSFAMLGNIIDLDMKNIDAIYKKVEREQDKAFQKGKEKTNKYIQAIFETRASERQKQQSTLPVSSSTSSEESQKSPSF